MAQCIIMQSSCRVGFKASRNISSWY